MLKLLLEMQTQNFVSKILFQNFVLHLNDTHIETAENLQLVMKHFNLFEYSDNYQDTVGTNFKEMSNLLMMQELILLT